MGNSPKSVEVILSAYEAERELRQVLEGYLRQTEPDFSIALADDGSGPGVERVADEFSRRGLRIRHVWQEDRGHRKTRIVNKAIAGSDAEYLILSDADCIPASQFIRDHLDWAEPGRHVCGRRVTLGPDLSDAILDQHEDPRLYESAIRLLTAEASGRLRHATDGVRLPLRVARALSGRQRSLAGCNAGVWMTDMIEINGFNNTIEGWGYEDSELEYRLVAAGSRPKAMRGRGIQFHLHHPVRPDAGNKEVQLALEELPGFRAASGLRECHDDEGG